MIVDKSLKGMYEELLKHATQNSSAKDVRRATTRGHQIILKLHYDLCRAAELQKHGRKTGFV
jgi:hypothetical protein